MGYSNPVSRSTLKKLLHRHHQDGICKGLWGSQGHCVVFSRRGIHNLPGKQRDGSDMAEDKAASGAPRMSDNNTENLMLEHLKRFQAGQDRIEKKLDEVVSRLGNLEMSVAGIRRDLAHLEENDAIMSVRMDRLNERVERIERRLELA
ncbi:hypothetical protein JKG47_02830 [Acidithiobacillus sp. MC6.1]|nr:hypothetical protein [Acidithiobacillus sp. MC6.1]